MVNTVIGRFRTLDAAKYFEANSEVHLRVSTLYDYCQEELGTSPTSVIDKDAYQTKLFQREVASNCLKKVLDEKRLRIDQWDKEEVDQEKKSTTIPRVIDKPDLIEHFVDLICSEIGVTIKGRDLVNNRKRYVESEKPLSRLHGHLTQNERSVVFDVFVEYNRQMFEEYEVLDSDDIALSVLGHFRTPLWEMKRKRSGYDFLLVDEAQLFNENERLLFHLLTKGDKSYLPIALALDEAQELRGAISAGFGRLGIENISNQMLNTVHRSTKEILSLAFFVIQRTTDLFTTEFPDFTSGTLSLASSDHPLASKPKVINQGETANLPKALLRVIRELRRINTRQIAIIVHADKYWNEIEEFFMKGNRELNVHIQLKRGETIERNHPIIVIARPETVGGQEYDAVICVGLEKGILPPNVGPHSGLSATLEQQAYREMYLSFTRARYQLIIMISKDAQLSPVLGNAVRAGYISQE
jgi:superfamily I DNA/RNA helicase